MTDQPHTPKAALILMASLVILGLAGLPVLFFWSRPAPPPPPLRPMSAPLPPLTTSPFLNTRAGVAYVGDQSCADCHRDQEKPYRQHAMGQSLFHTAEAPALEQYDARFNNPFQVGALRFEVIRQGPKVIHREWCQDAKGNVVAERREEMPYAIGSGSQARSYLYQRDGFLFESPITWFSQKSKWDLSPGYEHAQTHFHRPIEPRCLYCHCQEAKPVAHAINRYRDKIFGQLAIGCERCHGPGELHVASRNQGETAEAIDHTIVNPRHLAAGLRDAVCEQCHLIGGIIPRRGRAQEEYRPGLPLHEYMSIFVEPPGVDEGKQINGHVEQMHLSACFNKSAGRLGCISCHDPHRTPSPDERVAFYQQRCRNCHSEAGKKPGASGLQAPDCSLPRAQRRAQEASDSCVACHMPRQPSSVMHLAVTDHRVPRKKVADGPARPRALSDTPFVAFHRPGLEADEELQRDLALTLMEQVLTSGPTPQGRFYLERALPLLDRAARRAPDDVPILEARGYALSLQGRSEEGLKLLEEVLKQVPEREQALGWAGHVAEACGRLELAEQYFRRLVALAPHVPNNHQRLALLLMKRQAWPQARASVQAALKINPFDPDLRSLLVAIHLESGDFTAAQQEFDRLGVIDAGYQEQLRPQFLRTMKRAK